MNESPSLVAILVNQVASDLRTEWANMTAIAIRLIEERKSLEETAAALAGAGKCGYESVRRKLSAIQYAYSNLSMTEQDIVDAGQEAILSQFQKQTRAKNYSENVWMKWKLPGSLREVVSIEIKRVCEVKQFNSSEMFWEWFAGQLHNVTDEELRQS